MVKQTPQAKSVLNILLVFLLLFQVIGFFLHPVHTVTKSLNSQVQSSPSTDSHTGATGHDPINCDLCRLLNTSRSYLPSIPILDLVPAETEFTFVSIQQKSPGSHYNRAGFFSRAPPLTLLS